ncbi:MAG: DegT/DnrJ/EryC1/StrS family aminotransferase [Phycisphaerales bacterium]|nr:DegT/DnrJ/EryC1/StrS family aminotransferase [Phycisphaerales bacterium]MCI0629823.1 DegT/DnrJ/EryC1/StrS family aminotransferase [Phycisphaerales bacterium]MCI0675856.1 DegT/DnrJ/EryC1/StrS family aminotransferase [Phycisphaerales bacterium]
MPTAIAPPTACPAILGGPRAVTLDQTEANRWPILTSEDEQAVLRVMRTGQISISDETSALEEDYKKWLSVKHAVAHCNGTSAIHAALHAFDIGPGDEVIVPSATWWASVMPVLHCGGVPVFAETEEQCIGLDPADVEKKITPRTKAIVVVHLFGMPSKMNELIAVAKRHKLKVLEDASHAHGASYYGKPIGTLTEAAVFSMQANKLVPSAEGGMFLTNDADLWEKVIRFGHYERLLALQSPNKRFAATGFGYKFRMSPLSAAVARVQLRHLDKRNQKRNENCIYLSQELETISGGAIQTFLSPPNVQRVYFEYLVRVDERRIGLPVRDLAKALQAEGAQVGAPRYPLLHQQPMFTEPLPGAAWAKLARIQPAPGSEPIYSANALPRTAAGNASLLKLPSFPQADRALLDQYALAFEKVLSHAADLPKETASNPTPSRGTSGT